MDRFEVENFTTVTDLVDQDCTFSLPVKSEFDLVDLNRCFIQGGSTSFTDKYRLSNSQACVLFMEKLFPVPSCVYEEDENGETSESPKELRTEAQASTMWGIPDPSTLGSVQSSSEWEAASTYEGSKSYEYWDDLNAVNNNISYTNILDECDISFYGLPKGEAYICSWVNGGTVLCNNLNFFAINIDGPPPFDEESAFIEPYETAMERRPYGCYLVIDGQDDSKFPPRSDGIPIEQTVKSQKIRFINFSLSAEEQWYHAYYVQPLAYRLTFQDLEVYKMDLVSYDSSTGPDTTTKLAPPPVKRPELKEPNFDYSSMDGECIYAYSNITAYTLPAGGAGYLVFPSLDAMHSNIIAPATINVQDTLFIQDLSVVTCGQLNIGTHCIITDASVVNVGELGGSITDNLLVQDNSAFNVENLANYMFTIEGGINLENNSKLKVNFLTCEGLFVADTEAIIDLGTFYGDCELSFCSVNADTMVGDIDIRDTTTCNIGSLYAEGDTVFLRADSTIDKVFAYDLVQIAAGTAMQVNEWYGTLPAVDNQSSLVTGVYYPNLPDFPGA